MKTNLMAKQLIQLLGGKENILNIENCMTRIRASVKDASKVQEDEIKNTESVLGLVVKDNYYQIVLGPGIVNDVYKEIASEMNGNISTDTTWQQNKEAVQAKQNKKLTEGLRIISDIFTPMIPAFIASGICNGLGKLLKILMANGTVPTNTFTQLLVSFVVLIGSGFLAYLVVFTGVNAAKQFRVNPMLGGMIGVAVLDTNINKISELLGWFNADVPNESVLSTGAGGIIGVIVGVYLLSVIEKFIHKKMPKVLDITFTPLLSMLIVMPIFVLIVMPVTGYISVGIAGILSYFLQSHNPWVSALTGYIVAAIFLPLVLLGLHRGLTPIYTIQIDAFGSTSLFPAVAMAGAGQVGAAVALYLKARKVKNKKMTSIISGALPAGILGIGEPLIYGVTLPLLKPFITAGLGAGFGGAYVMYMHVTSTAFSPSGILAVTHMLPEKMLHYVIGIVISYVMAAIITYIFIPENLVEEK